MGKNATDRQEATRTLRIASYNIHHGADSSETLNLEATAEAIEALGADVIGLQEVDRFYSSRSDFVDQAAWLADRLGMHAEYAPTIDLEASEESAQRVGGNTRRQYGIALLSKYPLNDARMARLPENRDVERRGVLCATINLDGLDVRVAVTHLATTPSKIRRKQFDAVREFVVSGDRPAVIVGDLNAAPYHLFDYFTFTKNLVDAFAATHKNILSRIIRGRSNPVKPFPLRRIDYVLCTKNITPISCTIMKSAASDHLPIVAELAV